MYKIIGIDAKEYGPVEADHVRKWLAEGRVNARTRIKSDTDGNWKLLQDCPEFRTGPQPGPAWVCPKCGEAIEAQFDSCWRCSTPRSSRQPVTGSVPPEQAAATPQLKWVARYEIFRATFQTWEELFSKAAQFATEIGRDRLISISHSEDDNDGVVTVWYWAQEEPEAEEEKKPEAS